MAIKKYFVKIRSGLELSIALAKAGFKMRNEGSYLGIFWYLLNPVLMFGLLYFIFNDRLGSGIENYPLYLFIGVIMFNFFQSTTIEATRAIIVEHRGIIKSINFPRESLVLSIIFKSLFSHFFEFLLLLLLAIFLKASLWGFIFYPFILLLFCFFIFGVSLMLAPLTVYFVDMENIWNFAIRLVWLGTPIFYAIAGQTRLFYFNLINPLYYFITMARDVIIYLKFSDGFIVLGSIFFSLVFLIVGILLFCKLNGKIGEKI